MPRAPKGPGIKRGKREPDGREKMIRRPPSDLRLRPSRFEFDPKKAYSQDQLAAIGAISIKFTQLEHQIDFVGAFILLSKLPFWLKISMDDILSTDKKLHLLEQCCERAGLLDDASKSAIRDTLTQFRAFRGARNAIIHHSIYDHVKGVGQYVNESKKAYQVMVSQEALENLYNLICAVQKELSKVDLLFRIETDAQRLGTRDDKTGEIVPYPTTQLREQVIPALRKELQALQTERKSLPPLPEFPDADLIRQMWEEQARRSDPEEMEQDEQ